MTCTGKSMQPVSPAGIKCKKQTWALVLALGIPPPLDELSNNRGLLHLGSAANGLSLVTTLMFLPGVHNAGCDSQTCSTRIVSGASNGCKAAEARAQAFGTPSAPTSVSQGAFCLQGWCSRGAHGLQT
jgi:hypothetical protein